MSYAFFALMLAAPLALPLAQDAAQQQAAEEASPQLPEPVKLNTTLLALFERLAQAQQDHRLEVALTEHPDHQPPASPLTYIARYFHVSIPAAISGFVTLNLLLDLSALFLLYREGMLNTRWVSLIASSVFVATTLLLAYLCYPQHLRQQEHYTLYKQGHQLWVRLQESTKRRLQRKGAPVQPKGQQLEELAPYHTFKFTYNLLHSGRLVLRLERQALPAADKQLQVRGSWANAYQLTCYSDTLEEGLLCAVQAAKQQGGYDEPTLYRLIAYRNEQDELVLRLQHCKRAQHCYELRLRKTYWSEELFKL